jgi:hypothetical protein
MHTVQYLALLCFGMTSAALAQCTLGVNMPPPLYSASGVYPAAWPKWASVAFVEFNGIFCGANGCYASNTAGRFGPQIEAGANAWSNAGNNDVSLYLYGYTQPPVNPPWINWIAVNSPSDVDSQGDWGVTVSSFHNYGTDSSPYWRLGQSTIRVYGDMDFQYKAEIAAHETGHTFALNDCFTCQLGSTLMYDPANTARSTPSSCDIQQMNNTAYPN